MKIKLLPVFAVFADVSVHTTKPSVILFDSTKMLTRCHTEFTVMLVRKFVFLSCTIIATLTVP